MIVMEKVSLLVRNLILIVMVATFLDLLVPAGEMRRYVRMVVGLLVTVALVQAVGDFFSRQELALPALTIPAAAEGEIPDYAAFSIRYREQALAAYREGIARQVKALAGLTGIEVVRVEVRCALEERGYPQLQGIKLHLKEAVPALSQEAVAAEKAACTIADFYNLPRSKVLVTAP